MDASFEAVWERIQGSTTSLYSLTERGVAAQEAMRELLSQFLDRMSNPGRVEAGVGAVLGSNFNPLNWLRD
jgi:hypothetical protein